MIFQVNHQQLLSGCNNKPSVNFRNLLQERIDKTNPRHTLSAEEERRLSKLESIATKLKGNNTSNFRLKFLYEL